jgi:hypothetical protein
MATEVYEEEDEPTCLVEIAGLALEHGSPDWIEERAQAIGAVGVNGPVRNDGDVADATNAVHQLSQKDFAPDRISDARQRKVLLLAGCNAVPQLGPKGLLAHPHANAPAEQRLIQVAMREIASDVTPKLL